MTSEHTDPTELPAPGAGQFGRLYTHPHLRLRSGWACRHCPNLLTSTPTGGLVCLNCDTTMGNTDA